MLRILRTVPFFAPAYSFGGPVVHTINISKIQVMLGYDVRIFTTNILTNKIISNNLLPYEIIDGIKIHRFPIKYRLGDSHYFITPRLPSSFLKHNYDIIHSHSFRTFQTDVSTIFAKLKNKPFVFTAHGTLREMYLLNLFKGKEKGAKRMKIYDQVFKKMFLNTVDRIIVHSQHEKLWTLKFNIPESKIRVIPHGVNLNEFSNLSYREQFLKKFNVKGKMILYIGRLLSNYRDLEHLISIMNDVTKEVKNVQLWLVGHSIDKNYEYALRKKVKEKDLTRNVIFVTKPTREDIVGAYQTADLVVFPITNSDGFGIPLIEAGAVKCPVISTNRGPAPELVINGRTGILTEINNIPQLKASILKLLTDDELRKKMGSNAYENILKNYTWESVTKRINEVYDEII